MLCQASYREFFSSKKYKIIHCKLKEERLFDLFIKSEEILLNDSVVLLHCGCLSLNPFIEFRIWNNSLSPDVLNVQASISISPKYESKSKTTSHCHLLLHDCTNLAV